MVGSSDFVDFGSGRGRFFVQDLSLECAAETCRLVGALPNHLRSQQDQAVRAAARMPLAIAEGAGRQGRDRRHMWRIAYGTAPRHRWGGQSRPRRPQAAEPAQRAGRLAGPFQRWQIGEANERGNYPST